MVLFGLFPSNAFHYELERSIMSQIYGGYRLSYRYTSYKIKYDFHTSPQVEKNFDVIIISTKLSINVLDPIIFRIVKKYM